jgi:sRNA-binding carbon storage regulator CsrA
MVTLKRGEALRVGDAIVYVQKVGATYVKLGVDAPLELKIDRNVDDSERQVGDS